MSNGKGKQRATGDDEQASSIDRILSSAKGLASSAFAAPTSNELNDRSSALASAGKASQSSGSTAAWAESAKSSAQQPADFNDASRPGFRDHTQQHVAEAENDFSAFLDDAKFDSTGGIIDPEFGGSFLEDSRANGLVGQYQEWLRQDAGAKPPTVLHKTVAEQEADDGKAVMDLLTNGPDGDYNAELHNQIYHESHIEEPVVWKMTELQRTEWQQRLQKDFPQAQEHISMTTEHPLNLIPAGNILSEQERDAWLQQWEGVLNRYADEVWGDLLPLVQEAKEEVEAIKIDHGTGDGSPIALRRLGMILDHLRQ